MKKLALIACCLVICLMATSAMAANSVTVQSRTFTAGQAACTVGVFIENDIQLTGLVLPLEIRTKAGTAFYNGNLIATVWNFTPTGRLKNSPLGDIADPGGLWPAGNVTRRQLADPVPVDSPQVCSGPVSSSFATSAARGDTISPDGFLLATVSQGDPEIGEEIYLAPGTDGATPSMRFLINLIAGQDGCIIIDTACITPANHLLFVDENSSPILPSFTPGLLTIGTGSCAVVENQPPTAVCEPVTVYADGNCQGTVTPSELDPNVLSSDPEDGASISYSMFPSPPFALGQHQVNLVVTDSDGAADTCTTTLTVADSTSPSITCPSDIFVQCPTNIPPPYADGAAFIGDGGSFSDNCPGAVWSYGGQTSNAQTCPEVITRLYIVTDASGNADTCSQLITVNDTLNPVISSCNPDVDVQVPNGTPNTVVNFGLAIGVTDNCDLSIAVVANPPSGSVFNVGTTPVQVIATDDCGNSDTCTFNVNVTEDAPVNTPPDAICQDLNLSANDDCEAFATANLFNNGSNDAQDGTNLILSVNPQGPYPLGQTQVWLVVMDQGGLKDSCQATITVADATDPVITCPPQITQACDNQPSPYADLAAFLAAGGTASDNCDASLTFSFQGQNCATGQNCDMTCTRTYRVTDDAGNFAECQQVLRIRDSIPPVLGPCPVNINATVSFGSTDTIITFSLPSATDNCAGAPNVVADPPSGSVFPIGQTTVTVIATDYCNNSDTCTFTVTVTEEQEDAPPSAICTDVVVSVSDPNNCWADANINNGSFDPDGGSVTTDQNPAGPYSLGSTLVLLTVTDDEGDTDTCSAWVTVEDNTAPTLTCPSDKEVSNDFGQCGADVNFDLITATDVCDEDLDFTYSHASGSFFPVGTTTVEVIATDDAGNADTCYFDVIVNDTEPPVAYCMDSIRVPNDPGGCTAIVDWTNSVGNSDNCEIETSVFTPASGSVFPLGTTQVKHVVTDPSGNRDSCYFNVIVHDTSKPTVTCSEDIKVFAQFGQTSAIVTYQGSASDCGGVANFGCTPPSGSSFPIGQTTVWCVAEDAAGNRDSCSFTVTVNPGSLEAPGPHTETDTLTFKVTCACDTQTIDVYCVEEFGKGGDTSSGCLVYVQTQVPGISASPVPAQAPGSVDIIGCGVQLNPDTYSGWVFLHAATGAKTDSFWVILEVNEDTPGLVVAPDTLEFTYTGDIFNDKLCKIATINSTGCSEACWQFIGATGEWLWVDPTSGTTPDEIEICVFPCTLGVGVYYQTLEFCACPSKGDDEPKPVGFCDLLVVKLNVVNPAPVLVVDPLEIHFEIDCEKKALPVPVYVNNGGGGVLDWFAFTEANWFVIEPDAGDAPDTFYVSIIPDSIPCPNVCDTLLDSICVTGNKGCALNSPQYVLVELIICPSDTVVCDSICGQAFDCGCLNKAQCGLDGATVELWDSYPDGQILEVDTATWGRFCFGVEPGVEYDIRIWKKGYCTDVFEDVSCEDGYQIVCLDPLDFILPETPLFHDYYSQNATWEGNLILPGDVIYACDSNGVIVGLAYVEVPGTYLIHVLGNVPKVDDSVDEGTDPGEFVTLWLNCECPVTVNEGFVNFGNTLFDAAWDCRPTGICCELCPGWNMFSYNIYLPDYSRENVLATIDLNYDAVRSGYCDDPTSPHLESWFANRPVNDLTHVNPFHGYDIHMTALDTLCIEGEMIPAETPIYLCEGWNYIPYYPMEATSMGHALQSLAGNYTNVFNLWCDDFDSYNVTRPEGANDLFCLYPCRGYWIKMSSEDTLIYPTDGYDCSEPLPKSVPSYISGSIKGSPVVADFWSNSGLNAGDIVEVFSESGMLIGEAQVGADGMFLLHVFGDVPSTSEVEGAQDGEELTFRVNGLAASVEGNTRFGDRENSQITVRVSGANPIPDEYALLQNYPNPFNAGTVIPFTMKDASQWSLTVYNIMGQTVQTFEGFDAPGTVRVDWNGLDRNGANVPSGVYFYRVTTDTWTATKKMTLLK